MEMLRPDYIFEASWEVCNKVGGIHTVIYTKARLLQKWDDHFIMIGPELQKDTEISPEFIEDSNLFPAWKEQALKDGLHVRLGYWNIPSRPVVILTDFTYLYTRKNDIFGHLWLKYGLDSLSGQWDYINPALFGYAAGMVIGSFYHHQLKASGTVIAQFHEWMTGAGVLYLKEYVPEIATVFTTHATVAGRTLAGSDQPFYSLFKKQTGDQVAAGYRVVSKHSLEKTAAVNADCFTCVSEFTAGECIQFLDKQPDFITPNGFDSAIVPEPAVFDVKRAQARTRVLQVVKALLQQEVPENSLLVIKSGRYEFRNKGIDILIDSLGLLRAVPPENSIVVVIFVPAWDTGPRPELLERLKHPDMRHPLTGEILTHQLVGEDTDPICRRMRLRGIDNAPGNNLKVLFVPAYLEGRDGILNLSYYDLLPGFDLSVFPSYYEPWGYTPMESLAFHVPAITTNLSGFGIAVKKLPGYNGNGLYIVERNDENDQQAAQKIADIIRAYAAFPESKRIVIKQAAEAISKHFLWDAQIEWYMKAYSFALQKKVKAAVAK
ncbi:glycosyltransferase [Chitinophaga oryziterrae]|uniref:Glycosyltransferase n=1 Tax=Chitinophaga oryziterrae TaxID=1031224 RepID=A0A6N8JCN0_9BACT|nr:glycosyltransferase [Chitinophaga oryziterrae]MVT43017.1 glycosyltransferase [Chitinophaga oryziterrae]